MPRSRRPSLLLVTLLASAVELLLPAQARAEAGGRIQGRIVGARDKGPLSGVAISATSPALQGARLAVTDSGGWFDLPLLPPGIYTVDVSLDGYQAFSQEALDVHEGQTLRLVRSLRPEGAAGVFETLPPAPGLDAASARTGGAVTAEMMALVPYGRPRGFEQAATAVPRVYRVGLDGLQIGSSAPGELATLLDGVDVTNPALRQPWLSLLQELVQELDVTTAGGDAEQGRSTGGVLSVITPSGGNALHGSVFGSYSGTSDSEGGGELGGALVHDRLWFHAGVAGLSLPDSLQRGGARSQFAGKLTWLVAADQTLTFASHGDEGANGYTDASARYAGQLLDRSMEVDATAAAQHFGSSLGSASRLLAKVAATNQLRTGAVRHRLRYGLELERVTFAGVDDLRIAAFAQEAATLFERLTIEAGLRLERDPDSNDVWGTSTTESHLLPRVAVIYDPAGDGLAKIYASAGRYRAPPPLSFLSRELMSNPDGDTSDQVGGGAQLQFRRDLVVGVDYVHAYQPLVLGGVTSWPFRLQYDAATLSLTKLSTENYFLQASYTLSSWRASGSAADSPTALDHPNGLKLDAAYVYEVTARTSAALGLSFRAVQGGPAAAGGRFPWDTQLNLRGTLSYKLTPESTLAMTGDLYNVFDRDVQTSARSSSGPIAARASARLSF